MSDMPVSSWAMKNALVKATSRSNRLALCDHKKDKEEVTYTFFVVGKEVGHAIILDLDILDHTGNRATHANECQKKDADDSKLSWYYSM